MAGWRVGMVLGHKKYIDGVLQAKSNVDSGMFLPIQHAAAKALQLKQEWHDERNEIYEARRVKATKILEDIGIAKDTVFNRLEGNINGLTYEAIGERNIFICGDARPMGFSKSGNTSSTEGLYVAKLVVNKINRGKTIPWESPTTLCFSAVSTNPERAIFVNSQYAYNEKKKTFGFATPKMSEVWKGNEGLENAKAQYDWADALYSYMFKN